jgi:2-methylcitrate dehydratase PrpD
MSGRTRVQGTVACRPESAAGSQGQLQPVHMVWCIQRDFLQGSSTQAAVDAALAMVPNPDHDRSIDQVRLHFPQDTTCSWTGRAQTSQVQVPLG